MTHRQGPFAVLFDLDGTLVDTAPDLVAALTALADEHALPLQRAPGQLALLAGQGGRALIRAGLGAFDEHREDQLLARFFELYAAAIWRQSRLYPGIDTVLETLAGQGRPMAVVTNKLEYLARELVQQAGLSHYFGCLIGGDTTAASKPSPLPLAEACHRLSVTVEQAVMVGDSRADMLAAEAAGMVGVGVSWGYGGHGPEDSLHDWPVRGIVDRPEGLLDWLKANG